MKNVIELPIYHGEIHCFFDEKKYTKYCKKHNLMELSQKSDGVVNHYHNEKGYLIVTLGIFVNDVAVMVHELIHVISRIFLTHGIFYDTENDEPTAYLMGYLFREVNGLMYSHFNKATQ